MADIDHITSVDEKLRKEASEVTEQVLKFVTEQKAAVDSVVTKGRAVLQADKENLESLHEQKEAIALADEQLQQQGREERARVNELRSELEQLTAKESQLPPEQQRLTQQLSQSRSLMTQQQSGVEAAQTEKEHKLTELDRGIELYRSRLGLKFDKVGDDRLRLAFTSIDPADVDREFSFQVRVTNDQSGQYVVEQCEPHVAEMQALTDKLNADNDFAAYVRAMRRHFKALV